MKYLVSFWLHCFAFGVILFVDSCLVKLMRALYQETTHFQDIFLSGKLPSKNPHFPMGFFA